MQTIASSATVTAFVTDAGIDLVLRSDEREHRARATYDRLFTLLNGEQATVAFTDADDQLELTLGDRVLTLVQQPKGHFFSWLNPMPAAAARIDVAAARKLAAAAAAKNKRK